MLFNSLYIQYRSLYITIISLSLCCKSKEKIFYYFIFAPKQENFQSIGTPTALYNQQFYQEPSLIKINLIQELLKSRLITTTKKKTVSTILPDFTFIAELCLQGNLPLNTIENLNFFF